MAVKTCFTQAEIADVLAQYDEGTLVSANPIEGGTVQTNYLVLTDQAKLVFRFYENRTIESVRFETDLLTHLAGKGFPCAEPCVDANGHRVSTHGARPYVLFRYIEGEHVGHPNASHRRQLIRLTAELQQLTEDFRSPYTQYRWNYTPSLCRCLAEDANSRVRATRVARSDADAKLVWVTATVASLDLPETLPKSICHCDLHFSNVLYRGDRLVALLDFDDANLTYTQFDLVGLMEYWAWPHTRRLLDLDVARGVVQAYLVHRSLSPLEQRHLFDVYQLSILFDCVWYFGRGSAHNFYERRKIEALNNLGRERFREALFGTTT